MRGLGHHAIPPTSIEVTVAVCVPQVGKMTFRKLKTRANSDGIVAAWSKMWTEDSPQPQIAGTVISWLPNQVKRTAGTKQMPLFGILQEAPLFSFPINGC
jgi:hypothetical protein